MLRTALRDNLDNEFLALFVYGTLKQGCENHAVYCKGALSVEPARVRGKLYQHPGGFPMLQIPVSDIVAIGTADHLADMTLQTRHQMDSTDSNIQPDFEKHENYWRLIQGELMIFDDPGPRLSAIDELEEFYPGQTSLYRRVLIPVLTHNNSVVSAWVYASEIDIENLRPIEADFWTC